MAAIRRLGSGDDWVLAELAPGGGGIRCGSGAATAAAGSGSALVRELERRLEGAGVRSVWVLPGDEAESFYAACRFMREDPQPIQMVRRLGTPDGSS